MSNTLDLKVLDRGMDGDGLSTLSFAEIDSMLSDSKAVMQLTEAASHDIYRDTCLEIRRGGTFATTRCLTVDPEPMEQINSVSDLLSAIEANAALPSATSLASLNKATQKFPADAIARLDQAISEVTRAGRQIITFEVNGRAATFEIPHSAHIDTYLSRKVSAPSEPANMEVVVLEKVDVHDISFVDGLAAYVMDEQELPSLTRGTQLALSLKEQKPFLVVTNNEDSNDAKFK